MSIDEVKKNSSKKRKPILKIVLIILLVCFVLLIGGVIFAISQNIIPVRTYDQQMQYLSDNYEPGLTSLLKEIFTDEEIQKLNNFQIEIFNAQYKSTREMMSDLAENEDKPDEKEANESTSEDRNESETNSQSPPSNELSNESKIYYSKQGKYQLSVPDDDDVIESVSSNSEGNIKIFFRNGISLDFFINENFVTGFGPYCISSDNQPEKYDQLINNETKINFLGKTQLFKYSQINCPNGKSFLNEGSTINMKAGENSNGVSIGYGIIMPTNGQYSEFESSKDYIIAILESVKIENFDQADQAF